MRRALVVTLSRTTTIVATLALALARARAQDTQTQPVTAPAQPAVSAPVNAAPDAATASAAPAATPPQAAAPQGGIVHGTVVAGMAGKAGGVPLPGVAVTATNSLTGKKYSTATDINGVYAMAIPRNGRYVLRTELAGFAFATQEVLVNAAGENGGKADATADFGVQLASRVAAAEKKQDAAAATGSRSSLLGGLQSLSLSAGQSVGAIDASAGTSAADSGASMPSLAGLGDSGGATDSVAINGQMGQTNGLANYSEDEIRDRVSDAIARAKASGQMPSGGGDPTEAIVSMIGGMMGGGSNGGGIGGHGHGHGGSNGGGGGSSFRGFNPAQPHGSIYYQGDFSGLDSAQWSPTLTPTSKPSYTKNSYGLSLLGSPYIPGLTKPSTKQFAFINFSGVRNTQPEVLNGTVPTLAERMGDFSGLTQYVNGMLTQTPIYDPTTGLQFMSDASNLPQGIPVGTPNVIPATRITGPAANILNLNYYPLPNLLNSPNPIYNYQTITTAGQNTSNINARFIRNFGEDNGPFGSSGHKGGGGGSDAPPTLRQSLNVSFNESHSANDLRNIFLPLGGANESEGYALSTGYTIGYGHFNNNASLNWNRSHTTQRNYFTDTPLDPSAQVGITDEPARGTVSFRPNFYNGLPNLSFTNFTSLSNTIPSDVIGQTISFSDSVRYRYAKKHNMTFGLDIRRVHSDQLGGGNPLGTFTFSGFVTESPSDQAATESGSTMQASSGAGFADFLLGLPQQTVIQAPLSKIYLREFAFDAYAQDDYRVRSNLTINLGMRWEYFGPYSEKYGRLVNLTGVRTEVPSVGCVTTNGSSMITSPNGAVTGSCSQGSTSSLLHSDDLMYSPRFGLAWHPDVLKDTVIRTGYGINFNTSQFAAFGKALSYQPPFATVQNNTLQTMTNPTGCTTQTPGGAPNLTLATGFVCSDKLIQNNFSVNPNYRLGYVQVYNFGFQHTFPLGIVLNMNYNGSKGSDLDIARAPNHTPTSVTTTDAVAFVYQDDDGESRFNALVVDLRKRLQKGISLGATYTYSHSIDNASSIGGGAPTVSTVQNDARLDLEEGNSSFDVRHKVTGTWITELPFGPNRAFLNKGGFMASALDGFSLSGNFTFASGSYYTPQYQSSAAQISAGGTYTLRPDRVFSQPIAGNGTLRSYFNPLAFAAPVGYGTASRYSIEGPGQVVVDTSLSRTVQLGDTRSFEARMTASNVFNTVQYNGINTTLNSASFGQVTGAAAMRKILFVARYRF